MVSLQGSSPRTQTRTRAFLRCANENVGVIRIGSQRSCVMAFERLHGIVKGRRTIAGGLELLRPTTLIWVCDCSRSLEHCLSLLESFLKKPSGGFARHKYKAGYAGLPNPSDPLDSYRHAKAMSDADPLLPTRFVYSAIVNYNNRMV